VTGEEIVLGPLPKGITLAKEGMHKRVWNVLGHTYYMKAASESSFAFETFDPPGTGVPPHVHPTQDEHIYVLEGVFTLYLDGQWETAGPGDTVRMPRNLPHAYYTQRGQHTRTVLGEPGGSPRRTVRQAAQPRGPGRFSQWKHVPRQVRRIARRVSSSCVSYGVGR
jgi:mannose-6-phosphate isomerase-like protein (cupin superfamily)